MINRTDKLAFPTKIETGMTVINAQRRNQSRGTPPDNLRLSDPSRHQGVRKDTPSGKAKKKTRTGIGSAGEVRKEEEK